MLFDNYFKKTFFNEKAECLLNLSLGILDCRTKLAASFINLTKINY